ncbi:aldehyde dehydrogenase family protein [Bartonella sp. M0283]|nr:aldehyde dehydrogenase family protein [Bartonella sp. M0283]
MAAFKVGNGFSENVTIGPLITDKALEKVEEHLKDAMGKGATLVTGGNRLEETGHFFAPTLLTGITSNMKVAREETFGPLAPIFKFNTVEEVIAAANNTEFGLAAYFYSRDYSKIIRVAEALEYGMVGINTGAISTETAPFGGIKQSGIGREGSHFSLDDYTELKYLCVEV